MTFVNLDKTAIVEFIKGIYPAINPIYGDIAPPKSIILTFSPSTSDRNCFNLFDVLSTLVEKNSIPFVVSIKILLTLAIDVKD